jgi:nicotinate-nucleotide--dimethylbenzimidazole phosphoribosyltransferase
MNNAIRDVVDYIQPLDEDAMRTARERLDSLTKPLASLGRLEDLAVQLAGVTGDVRQRMPSKALILMAADHGIVDEGVSAYPQAVTGQMVTNFLQGGAAINVLARQADARVAVIDMGVASDLEPDPDLYSAKVAYGTDSFLRGPAMTREQAYAAVRHGFEAVARELRRGADLLATGEMGIGNTTASSAITSVLLRLPVVEITGSGTGLDENEVTHKVSVIERAIAVNEPDAADPIDVLAKLGGFEIAGLAGVILKSAAERRPVVIDGFITGAAALIAARLCPTAVDYMVAAHSSAEPGHQRILDDLGLKPLLDLDLRLGEGTGAVIAMHLVDAALALVDEMATFEEAAVANRTALV